MTRQSENPIAFSTLLYELDDAKDHLGNLIDSLSNNSDYTEEEYRIDLGHIYAHLNRAWNNRNIEDDSPDPDEGLARSFPKDLDPIS